MIEPLLPADSVYRLVGEVEQIICNEDADPSWVGKRLPASFVESYRPQRRDSQSQAEIQ